MGKTIKRLGYFFSALVLVGASMGGTVRVFADGINTGEGNVESGVLGEVAPSSNETPEDMGGTDGTGENLVVAGEGEGAGVVGVALNEAGSANNEASAEANNEASVAVGAGMQLRAAALPAVAEPAAAEEPVLRAAPVPGVDGQFLAEVGDTVELNIEGLADGSQRSCTVNGVNNGSEEVGATCGRTDGKVEISKVGKYEVQYSWRICTRWNSSHTMCRQYSNRNYSATIVAYDVTADPDGTVFSVEEMSAVAVFVTEQLEMLLETGETQNEALVLSSPDDNVSTWDYIWSALLNDPHFVVKAWVGETEFVEAADEVEAEIKDSETVAINYGSVIYIEVNGEEVGLVFELPTTPVKMQLAIPEEYLAAPAGFTRNFYVIRGHLSADYTTATATRITPTVNGNLAEFENDKFSTFTIVFEDVADGSATATAVGAPNTGAMTQTGGSASADLALATFVGMVVVLAFGVVKFARSRK